MAEAPELGKPLMNTNERGISVYQCSSVVCSFDCGQRLLCDSPCLCVSKRDTQTPDAHSSRNMLIPSANVRNSGVFCRLYDGSPRRTGSFRNTALDAAVPIATIKPNLKNQTSSVY